MLNRDANRLFEQTIGQEHFDPRQKAAFRAAPVGQQLTLDVVDFGFGHGFGGRDHGQRFGRSRFVIKHHGGLDGVVDGPRNQMQVVVGVHLERKDAQQRQ